MTQVKKTPIITFIISTVFLVASTSAIAEYSQTQNKVDGAQNSGEQSQPNTAYEKKRDGDRRGESSSNQPGHNMDQPDRNMNQPNEMDKKRSPETERKGGY